MEYIELRGENLLSAVIKGSEANAHLVANLALLDGIEASMNQYGFTREQVLGALRFYLDNEQAIEQARQHRYQELERLKTAQQ